MIGRFLEVWRIHKRISALEAERVAASRTRRLAIDEELIPLMAREIVLTAGFPVPPRSRCSSGTGAASQAAREREP